MDQNTDRTIDGMNSETFDEINVLDKILINQDAGTNKQVLKSNGNETLWGDVTDLIADDSITTAMLQDNCVTEEKVSDALIFNMTTKSTLSDSDFVAIADAADSNKNKKLSISKISELSNTYLGGTNLNVTGTSSPYTVNLDTSVNLLTGDLKARNLYQIDAGGGNQATMVGGDVTCLTLNGAVNYTDQQTLTINNSAAALVGTFSGTAVTITLPSPHSQLSAGTNINSSSLSSGTIATVTSPVFSGTTSLATIGGIAGDPIECEAHLEMDDNNIVDAGNITMSGTNNFIGATSYQKLNILQSGSATTFDITNSITEINTGFRLTFTATAVAYEFVFCAFCWMLSQNDYLYFDLYVVGNTTVLRDDRVFMYPDESDGTFLNVRQYYTGFTIGVSYTITIRAKESSTGGSNKIYMSGTFYPDAAFGCMPLNSGVATFFDPAGP